MDNTQKPALSVVMITLNEEKAVQKVVSDLRRVVPDAEIVVVDSSSDRTAEIARGAGCRVIEQLPPEGYGPAMHTALQAARGEIIITIDCDDTYPVEIIPLLVEKIHQGFDIVGASRLERRPAAMPLGNYVANRVFCLLGEVLCGVRSTDLHTGLRAYRRRVLEEFKYDPHGMALPVELLVGPAQMGYKYAEIFTDYRPRIGQTTLKPMQGTLWTLKRLWKWRKFCRSTP